MGGYGSYSNAYGGSGGQTGLYQGAGTSLTPHNTANLSDTEHDSPAAPEEKRASTPESSADEISQLTTNVRQHVKGLEARVEQLTHHSEDNEHPASPAPEMAHSMQEHIDHIKGLLAKLEKKAQAHCTTLTSNEAPSSASYSAPPIAAHSMGRAPSAYNSGSYSRYRY